MARREDKPSNQQTTDLLNSPPVQWQVSCPALLLMVRRRRSMTLVFTLVRKALLARCRRMPLLPT